MPQFKRILSTGEVARILGIGKNTVIRMAKEQILRSYETPGGHIKILGEDLRDFLSRNDFPLDLMGRDRKRILIVEDDPTLARQMTDLLKANTEIEIITTGTGYRAGFLTKELKPDLMILELRLKDGDGKEVIDLVRKDQELSHLKIVALAGLADAAGLKKAGVDEVIEKPLDADHFNDQISEVLGRKRTASAAPAAPAVAP